ncbi:MAG: hypothetical protein J3R72DRAFT_433820 [Linnemannia gamsii]|nr:MAG: hypothetical protein J3R72DRAFT_433820 [Linnemannia gamsii]
MQSLLLCNRALAVQELQDLISNHLSYSDLKACSSVSCYWSSLFAPFVWRGFTVQDNKRDTISIVRRNGSYFQKLTLRILDKTLLELMTQHCPNVSSLRLHFDHHSSRVQYSILSTFFSRIHTSLTSLYIQFDASLYPPSLLWSISSLTNLIRLEFNVFYSQRFGTKHHPPELYLSILQCCPTIQILVGEGSFLEQSNQSIYYNKDSMSVRLKRTLVPRTLGLPSHPPPATNMHMKYNLRFLHMRCHGVDIPTFHIIISHCPLLERLLINYGNWSIASETWKILSAHCPRLYDLQVWNCESGLQLPDSTVLFYLFPKLETLRLNFLTFTETLDPSDLKGCRLRYEDTYDVQEPPPLKSLAITGPNSRAFTILLYALTAFPALESLTIGNTNLSYIASQESLSPGYCDIKEPWVCHHSLTWLDLMFMHFPNQAILHQFFGHVGDLVNLTTLHVASSHLRTLMTTDAGSVLRLSTVFPTVTTLHISPWVPVSETVSESPFSWGEASAVIDAFPRLKTMGFLGALGVGLEGALPVTYPTIAFVPW